MFIFTRRGFGVQPRVATALRGATLGTSHTPHGNNPIGVAALLEALRILVAVGAQSPSVPVRVRPHTIGYVIREKALTARM